jgi:hypothetical protein
VDANLYIPVNIKTRFELFDGFALAELIPTGVMTLSSGLLAAGLYRITGDFTWPALLVLVTVAASVVALAKDQSNMSMVDYTRLILRFAREQQEYPYHYAEEWGGDA